SELVQSVKGLADQVDQFRLNRAARTEMLAFLEVAGIILYRSFFHLLTLYQGVREKQEITDKYIGELQKIIRDLKDSNWWKGLEVSHILASRRARYGTADSPLRKAVDQSPEQDTLRTVLEHFSSVEDQFLKLIAAELEPLAKLLEAASKSTDKQQSTKQLDQLA